MAKNTIFSVLIVIVSVWFIQTLCIYDIQYTRY